MPPGQAPEWSLYHSANDTACPEPMVSMKCRTAAYDNVPGGAGQVSLAYDAHLSLLNHQASSGIHGNCCSPSDGSTIFLFPKAPEWLCGYPLLS